MPKHIKCIILISAEDRDWLDSQAERTGLDSRTAYLRMMIRRERQEATGAPLHPIATRPPGSVVYREVEHQADVFDQVDEGNSPDPDAMVARAFSRAQDDGTIAQPGFVEPEAGSGGVALIGARRERTTREWAGRR